MNHGQALLFLNGNAAFFDSDGEQLPDLQKLGWSGLHKFLELYPDAEVLMQGGSIAPELRARVLRQLRMGSGIEEAV